MFCKHCGNEVNDNAVVCVKCGCSLRDDRREFNTPEKKEWLIVLLLCFFLGTFGIHRFYVGKTGTGIAQLLTAGGCGIWVLIDFIMILLGSFTDAQGRTISND
jgi:TM2 domain-containing membrane protein YozV